jgi:hypothetical protein
MKAKMPPVILKPDNFNADRMIVNVQTGQDLLETTKKIYRLPSIGIEFWTAAIGTNRRRFDLTEQIPEDPLTLYIKLRPKTIEEINRDLQ